MFYNFVFMLVCRSMALKHARLDLVPAIKVRWLPMPLQVHVGCGEHCKHDKKRVYSLAQ